MPASSLIGTRGGGVLLIVNFEPKTEPEMGPLNSEEFKDDPDGWTAKWVEGASGR